MQQQAERVVIGMDPHKRSATIEVMGGDETVLGGGRFDTSQAGFAAMVGYVNAIQPDPERRVWAVEGCNGIGHHIAMRLLAAGEQVIDVPPSCRPGHVSSPPARDARPMPPTPTPSPWSAPECLDCDRWSTTSSSLFCVSWWIAVGRWVRTTPEWSASCITCCSS